MTDATKESMMNHDVMSNGLWKFFLSMCDEPMLMLYTLGMYSMDPLGYVPSRDMLLLGFIYLEINFYLSIGVPLSPREPSWVVLSWISVPLGVAIWCVTPICYLWNVTLTLLFLSLLVLFSHEGIRFVCVGSHTYVLIHAFSLMLVYETCGLIFLLLV